jgi:hypothetical protein
VWIALELPVSCDRHVDFVRVHSNTSKLRVLGDINGMPGVDIVSETPTIQLAGGWVAIYPNINLKAGTYWVAMFEEGPMKVPTTCAFAVSGVFGHYWCAFNPNLTKWQGPNKNPIMVEAGECPM